MDFSLGKGGVSVTRRRFKAANISDDQNYQHFRRPKAMAFPTTKADRKSPYSMEEAEFLCDRVSIMFGGSMQCIGNSKELKTRYGGSCVLTISTNPNHNKDVEDMDIDQLHLN
ncbi:uncharacterized protein LOC131248131 [Magnolia sinica]|uniref:uncharacterized protein LOC131248131 n=1 Tax=Magnolia sinica TaxID=86752 RepID=UPI0026587BB7|nr:uncharacterized protein LOC131248131 [Magnolia sinica]